MTRRLRLAGLGLLTAAAVTLGARRESTAPVTRVAPPTDQVASVDSQESGWVRPGPLAAPLRLEPAALAKPAVLTSSGDELSPAAEPLSAEFPGHAAVVLESFRWVAPDRTLSTEIVPRGGAPNPAEPALVEVISTQDFLLSVGREATLTVIVYDGAGQPVAGSFVEGGRLADSPGIVVEPSNTLTGPDGRAVFRVRGLLASPSERAVTVFVRSPVAAELLVRGTIYAVTGVGLSPDPAGAPLPPGQVVTAEATITPTLEPATRARVRLAWTLSRFGEYFPFFAAPTLLDPLTLRLQILSPGRHAVSATVDPGVHQTSAPFEERPGWIRIEVPTEPPLSFPSDIPGMPPFYLTGGPDPGDSCLFRGDVIELTAIGLDAALQYSWSDLDFTWGPVSPPGIGALGATSGNPVTFTAAAATVGLVRQYGNSVLFERSTGPADIIARAPRPGAETAPPNPTAARTPGEHLAGRQPGYPDMLTHSPFESYSGDPAMIAYWAQARGTTPVQVNLAKPSQAARVAADLRTAAGREVAAAAETDTFIQGLIRANDPMQEVILHRQGPQAPAPALPLRLGAGCGR